MNTKRLSIILLFIGCLFFIITAHAYTPSSEDISFHKGHKRKAPPSYQPGNNCQFTPCVVGKFGSIQLSEKVRTHYEIEIGYFNQDGYHSLAFFQEGAEFNETLLERVFNKRKNRNIFNLEHALQIGSTNTIYLYGILLHYQLKEGDVVIVRLHDPKNQNDKHEYYFRYHRKGPIFDADVAIISPLNYFTPNPGSVVRNASIAAALSFSVGTYMDPERDYNIFTKFLYAWRLNLFAGFLKRGELKNAGGDQFVDQEFDCFVGAGFTFADFIIGGMGLNMARSPHTFFPFVGIEVNNLYNVLKSLKKSTKKRWKRYMVEQDQINKQ
ncbi:hypothetical protein KJ708_08510 [bacterium]|nr:hypothetical protein [bacterium]